MAVFKSKDLMQCRHSLRSGDIVLGDVTGASEKAAMLVDLIQRGVAVIPSPLAQLLSRSKVAQVDILGGYMHAHTVAIRRRKDLLSAMNAYEAAGIGSVVTKEEHMHCGHGVRKWDHVEMVYSFRGLDDTTYPFVLQPLITDFADLRVVMVGDYLEAYVRRNTCNFRANLSGGGDCTPYELSTGQIEFCREIVERAQFPYAHIDLHIMPDGQCHIFEIALNGGIRGSRLDRRDLDQRKTERLKLLAQELKA